MAMIKSNNISIYTISEEVGVSPATVSRALKNHPAISSEVRKKVLAIASKHNFKPRFVSNRATNICVLIQQYDAHPLDFGQFVSQVLEGIAEYCQHEELEMSLFSTHVRDLNRCDLVRELRRRNADGVVILRSNNQSRYLPSLKDLQFPYFCLLTNDGKPSDYLLSVDEENLAYKAVEHLIALGHQRIGVLVSAPFTMAGQLRLKGYHRALQEYGIEPDERLILTADVNMHRGGLQFGAESMELLLSRQPKLTAVFTTCEASARGALFWLYEHQFKVPDRVSIVGFDDYPETAFTCPPMTTVRIPYKSIGYEGCRQVHRLIRGLPLLINDDVHEKVKSELIIRKTTGPAHRQA